MQQEQLFYEDVYEALRVDIQALGGAKRVGVMLWPEKSPDKAGNDLNNCLNRLRPEKLDPEQVNFIKKEAHHIGSFAAFYFDCDDIGFTRPAPIEPEDEAAQLQKAFIESVKAQQKMLARLEKINLPQLSAVK